MLTRKILEEVGYLVFKQKPINLIKYNNDKLVLNSRLILASI